MTETKVDKCKECEAIRIVRDNGLCKRCNMEK